MISSGEMSVYLTDARRFGITLLHATGSAASGSPEHRAAAMGMALTPDGLRRGRKIVAAKTEADIYKRSICNISNRNCARASTRSARRGARDPAARRGRGSARHPACPYHRLGRRRHAGGDGRGQPARGYPYIGITDHSKTAHYAGGLSVEEIEQQHAEIDRLNAAFGGRFRIFKGIESDILPDGSLDYPDDVLRRSISSSAASTASSAWIPRRRPSAWCAPPRTRLSR